MRTTWMIWGVATIMTLASLAQAQFPGPPGAPSQPASPLPPPTSAPPAGLPGGGVVTGAPNNYPAEMTISVPEVEVRSGPSKLHYATSKLRQGDRVFVRGPSKDQPGWLAITPPAYSFSWIKAKFVKQIDAQNGFVQGDSSAQVPVMPGSSLSSQTPNVESVKVPAGSLVVILDKPHSAEGDVWLPIQPPPTEVRYIPVEAVSAPPMARSVTPAGGFPTNVGSDANLMSQADQAYRAGNLDAARQLYRAAAEKATDATQRAYALNRLASMQSNNGAGWQPSYPAPQNNLLTGQSTSKYNGAPSGVGPMISAQPPQWSGWGVLRKASYDKAGQPAFVLENRLGQAIIYVVPQPGTSLSGFVGQTVCLYGPVGYWSDDVPRVHYMIVSHIARP